MAVDNKNSWKRNCYIVVSRNTFIVITFLSFTHKEENWFLFIIITLF